MRQPGVKPLYTAAAADLPAALTQTPWPLMSCWWRRSGSVSAYTATADTAVCKWIQTLTVIKDCMQTAQRDASVQPAAVINSVSISHACPALPGSIVTAAAALTCCGNGRHSNSALLVWRHVLVFNSDIVSTLSKVHDLIIEVSHTSWYIIILCVAYRVGEQLKWHFSTTLIVMQIGLNYI